MNNEQQPVTNRSIPTGPGWWWRGMWPHKAVQVLQRVDNGQLWVGGPLVGFPVEDDGLWVAPIPAPDVCAALAEAGPLATPEVLRALPVYAAALVAWELPGPVDDSITDAWYSAHDVLQPAIREAQAEAEGGAP